MGYCQWRATARAGAHCSLLTACSGRGLTLSDLGHCLLLSRCLAADSDVCALRHAYRARLSEPDLRRLLVCRQEGTRLKPLLRRAKREEAAEADEQGPVEDAAGCKDLPPPMNLCLTASVREIELSGLFVTSTKDPSRKIENSVPFQTKPP